MPPAAGDRSEPRPIDLGRIDAAPAAPPDPPAPPPTHRVRIPNAAMALAAAVFLLAAAAVAVAKLAPFGGNSAEEVVSGFLEAARSGDIDGALAYTDQPNAQGDFLVPEALDTRWEVVEVAQVEFTESARDGRFVAQVYAEIEAFDGTRIGFRYFVGMEEGRTLIENALTASEAYPAFDHLDVNGVSVPVDEAMGLTNLVLLPGVYEFYPDLPPTMELDAESTVLALGNRFTPLGETGAGSPYATGPPIPWPTVSAEGEALIEESLRAYLDGCAADPSPAGCPFGFPEDPDRTVEAAPGAAWEITDYPRVDAQWWWYDLLQGFGLVTVEPGEARIAAVVTEGGESRETVVSCPIRVDGLFADLDFDGGAAIGRAEGSTIERCGSLVDVG